MLLAKFFVPQCAYVKGARLGTDGRPDTFQNLHLPPRSSRVCEADGEFIWRQVLEARLKVLRPINCLFLVCLFGCGGIEKKLVVAGGEECFVWL